MPSKRECPFSNERLYELYWRAGYSNSDLANAAYEVDGRLPLASDSVIKRWLREAQITQRTVREAKQLWAKLHPEKMVELHAKRRYWAERGAIYQGDASQMHTLEARRKWQEYQKRRSAPMVTKTCEICGAQIRKKAHRFARNEHATCSRQCRTALLAKLKQDAAPPIKRECGWCKKVIYVSPSRSTRFDVICCSTSCRSKFHAQKRKKNPDGTE